MVWFFEHKLKLTVKSLSIKQVIVAWLISLLIAFPGFALEAKEVGVNAASGAAIATGNSQNVGNAVVKVFSTVRYPDPSRPWTKQPPAEISGSGVIIEGNRILTNAHVVSYASQVQVQASQEGDKYFATIEAISPGIDLAVLKLEDETFFKSHAPLERAKALPSIKDAVLAYGFPTGGSSLSITKGIVSRIEFAPYNHPDSGLRIQIDAAINPGNSGGPAIVDDKMIGLAFSGLANTQNIGYIIPNEEIDLFLKDISDGHYDGKPALFDDLQTLENVALRAYLKLDGSIHGVIVNHPYQYGVTSPLKEWDVITKIGDIPIDDQGMIKLSGDLRVNFKYLIQKLAINNKVPLSIVRGGQLLSVSVPVTSNFPSVVQRSSGEYPSYFIYGPLVFSKVTDLYLGGLTKNAEAMNLLTFIGSPLVTERSELSSADREELVVISSPLLPHKITQGYANPQSSIVHSVNGTLVHSLRHLVALLRDLKQEYVVIQLEPHFVPSMVFNRNELLSATENILTDTGIRAQGSPDMLEVWAASGSESK